jgi:hypothetical protein
MLQVRNGHWPDAAGTEAQQNYLNGEKQIIFGNYLAENLAIHSP